MAKTVTARVTFPATGSEHPLAVLRVLVEDVTAADSSAVVVAEADRSDVVVPAQGVVVSVQLEVPDLDPARRYAVRAHGSVSGAATFATGDFLSTTATAPTAPVDLNVRLI